MWDVDGGGKSGNRCQIRCVEREKNVDVLFLLALRVFFSQLFVSHSTIIHSHFSLQNTQLWSLETGRRLWTLILQCTTQTGSTHSCTSTTTVQRENVSHKPLTHSSRICCCRCCLLTLRFFRPAHRARKPAVPPTAHSGIRTIQ